MQITTIGLDIAKNVFQVHGIDADEKVVVRKQLRRGQVIRFFEALTPCLVGLEACATVHHWARELRRDKTLMFLFMLKKQFAAKVKQVADRLVDHDSRSIRSNAAA